MRSELIALKLILDDLNISSDIKTVEDRKLIQKSIYLLQAVGGNLNYKYSWYKMGPYSTDLTADYYRLNEEIELGSEEYKKYNLGQIFKEKNNNLRKLFTIPENLSMSKEDWLELLSSVHFLNKTGNDENQVKQKIDLVKPHLKHGIDPAIKILKENNLLN